MKTLFRQIVFTNTVITVPLVVFCLVFAKSIIVMLFTDKYLASVSVFRINLFVLLIQMTLYGAVPKATGKTKAIFVGNLIRAMFLVPVSYVLLKQFGLIGGALAFVLAFWLNAVFQLRSAQKSMSASLPELLPWKHIGIVSIISIAAVMLVLPIASLRTSPLELLLLAGAAYAAVVLFLFRVVGYLNRSTLRWVLCS